MSSIRWSLSLLLLPGVASAQLTAGAAASARAGAAAGAAAAAGAGVASISVNAPVSAAIRPEDFDAPGPVAHLGVTIDSIGIGDASGKAIMPSSFESSFPGISKAAAARYFNTLLGNGIDGDGIGAASQSSGKRGPRYVKSRANDDEDEIREAMAEHSFAGRAARAQAEKTRLQEFQARLGRMFTTLATMNPIEQDGVYPLPPAQRDRFTFTFNFDQRSHRHSEESMPLPDNPAMMGGAGGVLRHLHDQRLLQRGPADSSRHAGIAEALIDPSERIPAEDDAMPVHPYQHMVADDDGMPVPDNPTTTRGASGLARSYGHDTEAVHPTGGIQAPARQTTKP